MPARLAELIRDNQPCVVLTGAGVSTESGIPDFRSGTGSGRSGRAVGLRSTALPNMTGIWAQYDPMEYASIDAFLADPVKVWDFYAKRLDVLASAEPNGAHLALAELEQAGWVRAVVTQNVDRLHERAGSRELIEVHGSLRTSSCRTCGLRVPFAEIVRLLETLPAPPCPACGTILKPDVVMFGELLPARAIDQATRLAREAALLLVVGSSLEVYPVAGLCDDTLAAGGRLAIVTMGETPYDRLAELKIEAPAAETLAAAAAALAGSTRPPA